MREAIGRAAQHWVPDKCAELESIASQKSHTEPKDGVEALAWAFSQPKIPDEVRCIYEEIGNITVNRMRGYLHLGRLNAYYFTSTGHQIVPRLFWATPVPTACWKGAPIGRLVRQHDGMSSAQIIRSSSEIRNSMRC